LSETPTTGDAAASTTTTREEARAHAERETALALRNSVKLGLSLAATLVVAISIRFWLPRALGPEVFGQLHFAESFAVALFLFTSFGVDSYIAKEVATRTSHAEEFLGGTLVLRALLSVVLVGGMYVALPLMGKGELQMVLCSVMAGWQLLFTLNGTLATLLQAKGTVDELSLANAVSKILWGGSIAVGLVFGAGAVFVAWCFLFSELAKAGYLFPLALRRLGIALKIDVAKTRVVVLASIPFFLNTLAHRIYDRIDVQMLSVMVGDEEVGFYGAAANLAMFGLLFIPVVNAVVFPMGSRIAEVSKDELGAVMRGAIRLVIVVGALVTFVLVLHADELAVLLFGERYAPSARSLQMLAPNFPLTYLAVLTSVHLIPLDRVWTVTKISLVGLFLNPVLNYFAIPYGFEWFGVGGGGMGAAFSSMLTEVVASMTTLAVLGREAVDRKLVLTFGKILLLAAVVYGVHRVIPLPGLFRLPFEVIAFVVVAWVTGALPLRRLLETVVSVIRARSGK